MVLIDNYQRFHTDFSLSPPPLTERFYCLDYKSIMGERAWLPRFFRFLFHHGKRKEENKRT